MMLKNIGLLIFLLTFLSCARVDITNSGPPISFIQPVLVDLSVGTYSVPCFFNKLATQGIGSNIYSKSTMTLNEDGTGTNAYELYDDVNCTNLVTDGTITILHYETVIVNSNQVLMMEQDDGNSLMTIWIGYSMVGSSTYFDVDWSDNESGPYLTQPTPFDLTAFVADPVGQGVLLNQ